MLYKYRDWKNEFHRKWLTTPEVYFASIKDFNDPFDSSLRYRYEELSPQEQRKAIKRFNDHLSDKEIEEKWKESSFANPELFDQRFEELVIPMIKEDVGILSLTPNYDNLLMWSHYANSHEGFCIGYSDKLMENLSFNHFAADNKTFISQHKITYSEDYPYLNPNDLNSKEYTFHLLTVKSQDWAYEKEQRLISHPRSSFSSKISSNLIKEVRLGCKMSEETISKIIELIENDMTHVKIFKANKSNTSFKITFEQIAG